jgi:DNA-directed RNA polymerase specialized sigma24 family protein
MTPDDSFHDLVRRVRRGDEDAATQLVQRYGPGLRRAVRARLTDPHLRRTLDSMDICQSVLASFFVRAAAGQYELNAPGQLVRLLAAMAHHKLLRQVERLRADRRGGGRPPQDDVEPADPGPDHQREVDSRELLQQFRSRLSEQERWLADQRGLGRSWADIAAEVGENADALRMRLSRATERVARELEIDA